MTAPLFPTAEAEPAPPSAFTEFYARYPRKVGKGSARKAYAKAIRAVSHDDIMFGLSQQLPGMEATDKQFIPHPATWLNRESWDDEPEEPTSHCGADKFGAPGVQAKNGRRMGKPSVAEENANFAIEYARSRAAGGGNGGGSGNLF